MASPANPGSAGEHPDSAPIPGATPSPLGIALKTRRTDMALSQRALARASGVPQSAISQLESGTQTAAEPATVAALALALNCTTADLTGEPPAHPSAADSAGFRLIPHNRIKRSALNPRKQFDPAALADLAASLKERGVLQNLLVRPDPEVAGDFIVVAGERRWRAAGLLVEQGHWPADHPLPCKEVDADEAEHRTLAVIENLQREQVAPLDEAEAFRELLTYDGWDTERIARSIGKTPRHVQLRLALLNRLDENVQQALGDGTINLATARALTAAPLVLQRDMLDRIVRGDPSLRRAEDIASQVRAAVFPARRAIFDLADYTGERAEDTVTGEALLLDAEQCRRLQSAAITAKVEELQIQFGWVLVMEHNDWWTPGGGDRIVPLSDLPPGEDAVGGVGAVVRVAGNFDVAIFLNLAKRPAPARVAHQVNGATDGDGEGASTPPPPHPPPVSALDPVEAVSQERRAHALRAKSQALQAALLVHPDAWMHQLVLSLLGCRDVCDIAAPPPRPENAVVDGTVATVLAEFHDRLGTDLFIPMDETWPYLTLARTGTDEFTASVSETALALLPRLQALPVEDVFRLLAALTASRCGTRFLPARPNLGDSPLVIATAAASGADVAMQAWTPDAAYLGTLDDSQLETLGWAIGAIRGEEETQENPPLPLCMHFEFYDGLKPKKRLEHILDFIAANGVRHLPPELRFAPRAEVEAALQADAGEAAR